MFCPKCKSEYIDGIIICPDCDVELVNEIPDEKIEYLKFLTIISPSDPGLLAIAKELLKELM